MPITVSVFRGSIFLAVLDPFSCVPLLPYLGGLKQHIADTPLFFCLCSCLRHLQCDNVILEDLSFPTIAGEGTNGAVIHYGAKAGSCGVVGQSSMLLLDSGAQYEDGTTDVTRTMHFGEPTAEQKEVRASILLISLHRTCGSSRVRYCRYVWN